MIDELKSIAIFCKVVETHSFRKAADYFQLSPSVISHHVTMLEAKTKVALLYRSTRKLSLTSEGQALYEACRDMLSKAEQGLNRLNQDAVSGQLTIAMAQVLMNSPITQGIADFSLAYPGVHIQIKVADNLHDFNEEGIDIGFRIGQLKHSALKARPLFNITRQVVASPLLFQRFKRPRQLHDLLQLPWINPSMISASRCFYHQDGRQEILAFKPTIRVDSVDMAYALALKGAGITSPPDYLIKEAVAQKKLMPLLKDWQMQDLPVWVLWQANASVNSLAVMFKNFIFNKISNQEPVCLPNI